MTGEEGAIWMSGSGLPPILPAIFTSSRVMELGPNLTVLDYFTPFNQAALSAVDQDVGAGGVLLVPDQTGAVPHKIIGCGKAPSVFVLNRDNMGKFQSGSNSQIVQELKNQVGGTTGIHAPDRCFTTPAFWQQHVYLVGNNDVIKAFALKATGKLSLTPTSKGTFQFVFPGAQPVVSSNGSVNGIVWAVDHSPSCALHAYDARNLGTELYRSSGLGAGAKWAVPTVVNSKVYVGTAGKLFVFGPI